MNEVFAILVTGTRHADADNVEEITAKLSYHHEDLTGSKGEKRVLIVHGGCTGVDKIAEEWAKENKLRTLVFPYAGSLGKLGGPTRNLDMVRYLLGFKAQTNRDRIPDGRIYASNVRCVGFPALDRDSRGSRGCIDMASRNNIPTFVTELELGLPF